MEESAFVPKPVCEVCWVKMYSKWEPESVNEEGTVLFKLLEVLVPEKINNGTVEMCEDCGSLTVAGIYEMRPTDDEDWYGEER